MFRNSKTGILLAPWNNSTKPHQTHQSFNALLVEGDLQLLTCPCCHSGDTPTGFFHILLINQAHNLQVQFALFGRLVVIAGARQLQKLALLHNTKSRMFWLNQQSFLVCLKGPFFFWAIQVAYSNDQFARRVGLLAPLAFSSVSPTNKRESDLHVLSK